MSYECAFQVKDIIQNMQTDQTSAKQKAVMREINSGDIRKLFKGGKNDALEESDTCIAHRIQY